MAVAMESAKLVTAGWLAKRWRVTAWLWRLVLVGLIAGLAIINYAGVYAQLVTQVGDLIPPLPRSRRRTEPLPPDRVSDHMQP
jgi:hypothetical protein